MERSAGYKKIIIVFEFRFQTTKQQVYFQV